ncbi:MAG: hypothetical protein HC828_14530 [Blastochloris sp.]|nr:hypothetical protein [Blastochloris sp.]
MAGAWRAGREHYPPGVVRPAQRHRVPFGDTYSINAYIALETHEGQLSFSDLFRPLNGHRLLASLTLTSILTLLTDWNTLLEVWFNPLLGIVNVGLFVWLVRRFIPEVTFYALIAASVLMLSIDQAVNWLLTIHNGWHIAVTFILLALLALGRQPETIRHILVALIFGILATFSFGTGIVVWPMILVFLLLAGNRHPVAYLLTIGIALVCTIGYISNTVVANTPGEVNSVNLGTNIGTIVHYSLSLLGRPLVNDLTLAAIVSATGLIMLTGSLLVLQQLGIARRVFILVVLALYPLLNALIIAYTRADLSGLNTALTERYYHISAIFWTVVLTTAVFTLTAIFHTGDTAVSRLVRRGVAGIALGFIGVCAGLFAYTFHQERDLMEYGFPANELVLLRRDNVEHLVMIGGPNDLVIEASIVAWKRQT